MWSARPSSESSYFSLPMTGRHGPKWLQLYWVGGAGSTCTHLELTQGFPLRPESFSFDLALQPDRRNNGQHSLFCKYLQLTLGRCSLGSRKAGQWGIYQKHLISWFSWKSGSNHLGWTSLHWPTASQSSGACSPQVILDGVRQPGEDLLRQMQTRNRS